MSMDMTQRTSHEWLCKRGVELLRQGDKLRALKMFELSYELNNSPECRSYLGFLSATERGLVRKGIDLCHSSIEDDPQNPLHYLNLGKLLYSVEKKNEAVETVRKARGMNAPGELVDEMEGWLKMVGIRKRPVLPFLRRSHPINKYVGLMLKHLGLR